MVTARWMLRMSNLPGACGALNSDGISTASELFTLEELGIASLDTAYKNNTPPAWPAATVLPLPVWGSFTKADGTATAKWAM